MTASVKLKRARSKSNQYTMYQFLTSEHEVMHFDAEWKDLIGEPAFSGTWIIWGQSGSGKTRFTIRLANYLMKFGTVLYNSLEEGNARSLQRAFAAEGFTPETKGIVVMDRVPISELSERLSKRKSPRIVIIDSLQYTRMSYNDYIALKEKHLDKLFIYISHAKGKEPRGATAESVRYDADVKIHVEGYRAFAVSRHGGGIPYTIWQERADKYWNDITEANHETEIEEKHENEE